MPKSFPEIQTVKQRFGIIGNSDKLNYAIQVAIQVAATDLTVLITGESGSGKESFSKIIHSMSARKHGSFIAINCGAIPEGTINSELFGHEKGSFTGATDQRKGYFEVADGGTIFLDEAGEMPMETQARLLRVLENKEFIRVGSSKVQKTDVRVVAATNVNLLQAVHKGKFREDLYYRLNTVPIEVPPLRERGQDIELLFRKFVTDFAETHRVPPLKLTPAAREVLLSYPWPGNIRQLKNISDQMSVLVQDREIDAENLRKYLPGPATSLPALREAVSDNDSHKDYSDRDLLYRILFDMRAEVSELKQLVLGMIQNGNLDANQVMREHPGLFKGVTPFKNEEEEASAQSYRDNYFLTSGNTSPTTTETVNHRGTRHVDLDKIQDIEHEPEEEVLSIEKKEKELIEKALKKNKNKRKYAALDLGISERTLYRKIKQYEIDKMD